MADADRALEAAREILRELEWTRDIRTPPTAFHNRVLLVATALLARGGEGWRTIDSAPKGEPDEHGDITGPWISVWLPKSKISWTARWRHPDWMDDADEEDYWESYYSETIGGSTTRLYEHPTHWQSLPSPPTAGTADTEER